MKLKDFKERWNGVLPNLLVVAFGICLYFLIKNISYFRGVFSTLNSILSPVLIGFVIAYLLNKPIEMFENKLLVKLDKKKKHKKLRRTFAITCVYIIAFAAIIALIWVVIPQIIESVKTLLNNTDIYLANLQNVVSKIAHKYDKQFDASKVIPTKLGEIIKKFNVIGTALETFYTFATGLGTTISNFVIGIVFGIYFNFSKELFIAQTKKVITALFTPKTKQWILKVGHLTDDNFNGFLVGKIIDSTIVGIICFIFMFFFKMPYAVLISVIVGVTNMIPVFGPFIGAVPSALIILIVSPIKCLWFIVFIIVLQQIDGNIIGPRILGNSIGLSSFWVMFAIVLGGGLWGVIGMIVGVPICAVIYLLVKELLEGRLESKSEPLETSDYFSDTKNS